jgi:hypothetical protein
MNKDLATIEIKSLIYHLRGKAVMLDSDLAILYKVDTRSLNQAVRRNLGRFPEDFMFQLTPEEFKGLISQSVTSKSGRGGRRKLPLVFTEQGVAMLSSVLKSEVAIKANIQIMRAFVQIRRIGLTYAELKRKIENMELKYDYHFRAVFKAIKDLEEAPFPRYKGKTVGFTPPEKD